MSSLFLFSHFLYAHIGIVIKSQCVHLALAPSKSKEFPFGNLHWVRNQVMNFERIQWKTMKSEKNYFPGQELDEQPVCSFFTIIRNGILKVALQFLVAIILASFLFLSMSHTIKIHEHTNKRQIFHCQCSFFRHA